MKSTKGKIKKKQSVIQRKKENHASFFGPGTIQPQLTIGQPDDQYEQEADAMAEQVVNNESAIQTKTTSQKEEEEQHVQAKLDIQKMDEEEEMLQPKLAIQKEEEVEEEMLQPKQDIQKMDEEEELMQPKLDIQKMDEEEEMMQPKLAIQKEEEVEEEMLQSKPLMMKSSGGESVATPDLESQLNQSKGSGQSLPKETNQTMSQAFGADFSDVKVHTDGGAVQMNKGLQARAFTHGSDIYFNQGEYSPGSKEGKRLLAHELTHVVQQGGVSNSEQINRNIKRNIQKQEGGGATSPAAAPTPATAAPADHFKIELKAWIPHRKVVDPEEKMRMGDWGDTYGDFLSLLPFACTPNYEYDSYYRGDNHAGYNGSYRVLSTLEFDWDGTNISSEKHKGKYGTTHRDYKAQLLADCWWDDYVIKEWNGTESKKATSATNGTKTSNNSFTLGMASANPLVMTFAPDIDSDLSGQFVPSGSGHNLRLSYNTDLFPSHGVRVIKNGSVISTSILNNAAGVYASGMVGAIILGHKLTSQSNSGTVNVPV